MMKKVARSIRMASVRLHAWANVVRCFNRTTAFAMIPYTTLDQARSRQPSWLEARAAYICGSNILRIVHLPPW